MMLANVIQGRQRPKYLIHATYWENVYGIMQQGIVPAKNPTSELRQPFRDLLQGAESHVYTLSAQNVASRLDKHDAKADGGRPRRSSEPDIERRYKLGKES